MRLGLFDANGTSPNRDIPVDIIGAAEHKQASLDAARQVQWGACIGYAFVFACFCANHSGVCNMGGSVTYS